MDVLKDLFDYVVEILKTKEVVWGFIGSFIGLLLCRKKKEK